MADDPAVHPPTAALGHRLSQSRTAWYGEPATCRNALRRSGAARRIITALRPFELAAAGRNANPGDHLEPVAVGGDYLGFAPTPGERATADFTTSIGTVHVRRDRAMRIAIIAQAVTHVAKTGGSS